MDIEIKTFELVLNDVVIVASDETELNKIIAYCKGNNITSLDKTVPLVQRVIYRSYGVIPKGKYNNDNLKNW